MAFVDPTDGSRVVVNSGPVIKLTMKAASTCLPGDPLGYNSGWVQADADGGYEAEYFALQAGAAAQEISVSRSCTIDFGSGCTGTVDGVIYLSNTAGAYTSSAPTNAQIIGALGTAQVAHMKVESPVGGPIATLTQTYATADGTLASPSAAAMGTTVVTSTSPFGYATTTQGNDVATQINALRVDLLDLAQFVNSVVDNLQKVGIFTPALIAAFCYPLLTSTQYWPT